MLLTSWIRSLRFSMMQKRHAARLARRNKRRGSTTERLEDRLLLTALVIDDVTPGAGITVTNSDLDLDSNGLIDPDTEFDTLVIDSVSFNGDVGLGVNVTLSNLTLDSLVFRDLTITGSFGAGLNIVLNNVTLDAIIIDRASITSTTGGGVSVDLQQRPEHVVVGTRPPGHSP